MTTGSSIAVFAVVEVIAGAIVGADLIASRGTLEFAVLSGVLIGELLLKPPAGARKGVLIIAEFGGRADESSCKGKFFSVLVAPFA